MSKFYGNLINRLEEGQNYSGKELVAGTDITMYYWSDRSCYYITRVDNQKHIFVKQYEVVADRDKEGGMGHQNWVYFKTRKECNDYLRSHGLDAEENPIENKEQEWAFRYGKWFGVSRYNLDRWNSCLEMAKTEASHPEDIECVTRVARYFLGLNDEDFNKVMSGKEVIKYNKLQPVSFGVRDYYYDWEF